jgi:hypothetical protein
VDPATGLIANPSQTDAVEEEFLEGTAPTEVAMPDAGAPPEVDAGAPDAAVDDEARESHDGVLPESAGVPDSDGGAVPPF